MIMTVAKKTKKKKLPYSSLSINKDSMERFKLFHKNFGKNMNSLGFFDYLLDLCQEMHCPECGQKVRVERCSCKAGEVL